MLEIASLIKKATETTNNLIENSSNFISARRKIINPQKAGPQAVTPRGENLDQSVDKRGQKVPQTSDNALKLKS